MLLCREDPCGSTLRPFGWAIPVKTACGERATDWVASPAKTGVRPAVEGRVGDLAFGTDEITQRRLSPTEMTGTAPWRRSRISEFQ